MSDIQSGKPSNENPEEAKPEVPKGSLWERLEASRQIDR
jgi:hypothetical protein